jgi:hypothetical protein
MVVWITQSIECVMPLCGSGIRGTGILPVGPVGFQPAELKEIRRDARSPHRLEVCATLAAGCKLV